MSPSDHPLAALLGPLRYACERNFVHLGAVKDLRRVIEPALPVPMRQALAEVLAEVDSGAPARRKAALQEILFHLRQAGLALPAELGALADRPTPQRLNLFAADPPVTEPVRPPAKKEPPAPTAPAPLKEPPPRTSPPPLKEPPKPSPSVEEPGERKARSARAKKKKEAVEEEARLLSIAPQQGPLSLPLRDLNKRMNPRLLATLNRKGVRKVGDVLFLLPRAYEDRRRLSTIAELRVGERGVTVGTVRAAGDHPIRGGRRFFRAVLADETGSVAATYFQSGPWLKARFPIGQKLLLSGELRASHSGREMPHPEVEPADDLDNAASIHFGRIVPVYPGFERHEQRAYRELAHRVGSLYAEHLEEPLPEALRTKLGLLDLQEAIRRLHFPRPTDDLGELEGHLSAQHRRLAFDELFFLQLGMALKRQGVQSDPGVAFEVGAPRLAAALAALPFSLTQAQARVVKEILGDMGEAKPMLRLLQGDVGSGKTAVALVCAAVAMQNGYQVALMAPTEILAEQHHRTAKRLLEPRGFKVGLFTGAGGAKERREARARLASGETTFAVGTHALIQEGVEFSRLGLAVIDEQHRFGVIQRHALMSKGVRPDVLVMTATPIPRTLAMTLHGDLEVSLIDELPPGRTPILTRVFSEKQRARVYEAMAAELSAGHQAYVIYPLVEESEKLDLADATQGAERIRAAFPDRRVGLLHGRMKADEKELVMTQFRDHALDILVATTVVEVGVDVPNASVIAIESAERFGLSQLHQLRGRVGRGAAKSYCFLVSGYAKSKESADRLLVMERSNDGFVIAEKDLELRGPGEFLGTRQSGLPELAVANLARDVDLLALARKEAQAILAADPSLRRAENRPLVKALEDRWEGRLALAQVG